MSTQETQGSFAPRFSSDIYQNALKQVGAIPWPDGKPLDAAKNFPALSRAIEQSKGAISNMSSQSVNRLQGDLFKVQPTQMSYSREYIWVSSLGPQAVGEMSIGGPSFAVDSNAQSTPVSSQEQKFKKFEKIPVAGYNAPVASKNDFLATPKSPSDIGLYKKEPKKFEKSYDWSKEEHSTKPNSPAAAKARENLSADLAEEKRSKTAPEGQSQKLAEKQELQNILPDVQKLQQDAENLGYRFQEKNIGGVKQVEIIHTETGEVRKTVSASMSPSLLVKNLQQELAYIKDPSLKAREEQKAEEERRKRVGELQNETEALNKSRTESIPGFNEWRASELKITTKEKGAIEDGIKNGVELRFADNSRSHKIEVSKWDKQVSVPVSMNRNWRADLMSAIDSVK